MKDKVMADLFITTILLHIVLVSAWNMSHLMLSAFEDHNIGRFSVVPFEVMRFWPWRGG